MRCSLKRSRAKHQAPSRQANDMATLRATPGANALRAGLSLCIAMFGRIEGQYIGNAAVA
ncbi:hypothetical protein HRbin30_02214 [bacterium HR30]|nr:hypothetical protein HRbin30_02214 [bacterium HR30]